MNGQVTKPALIVLAVVILVLLAIGLLTFRGQEGGATGTTPAVAPPEETVPPLPTEEEESPSPTPTPGAEGEVEIGL